MCHVFTFPICPGHCILKRKGGELYCTRNTGKLKRSTCHAVRLEYIDTIKLKGKLPIILFSDFFSQSLISHLEIRVISYLDFIWIFKLSNSCSLKFQRY